MKSIKILGRQIEPMRSLVLAMYVATVVLGSFEAASSVAAPMQAPIAKRLANSEAKYADAKENANRQANEWIARGTPGLALAIGVDGHNVYSKGFGYADLEEKVPVSTTTKFRIGSISKPLTAVGLMVLAQAGKVDLDAPVQKYVPSFPEKGAMITVRMLAGHLAGIRHYEKGEFDIQKHYASVSDGLKIFQDDPLVSQPGKKFNYSSYGYNLLSAVIESAAQEDFLTYMQDEVFNRFGLLHTTPDLNAAIVDQRSRFYQEQKDGRIENAPHVDNSYKWGSGGFLSTADDLVHFGSGLLKPDILNGQSLRTMFTSQRTDDGKETGYGIGWTIRKSNSGKVIYEHSGESVGGHCKLIIYPGTHIVVALVTNLTNVHWTSKEVEAVAEKFE